MIKWINGPITKCWHKGKERHTFVLRKKKQVFWGWEGWHKIKLLVKWNTPKVIFFPIFSSTMKRRKFYENSENRFHYIIGPWPQSIFSLFFCLLNYLNCNWKNYLKMWWKRFVSFFEIFKCLIIIPITFTCCFFPKTVSCRSSPMSRNISQLCN